MIEKSEREWEAEKKHKTIYGRRYQLPMNNKKNEWNLLILKMYQFDDVQHTRRSEWV